MTGFHVHTQVFPTTKTLRMRERMYPIETEDESSAPSTPLLAQPQQRVKTVTTLDVKTDAQSPFSTLLLGQDDQAQPNDQTAHHHPYDLLTPSSQRRQRASRIARSLNITTDHCGRGRPARSRTTITRSGSPARTHRAGQGGHRYDGGSATG